MRPTQGALVTPEVTVNHVESGSGTTRMCLVHGLGVRWQVFGPLAARLSDEWRIHALDLRGHGQSGRVPGGYTLEGFTDDVLAWLERVVAQPAVLFGHSVGGLVALRAAALAPERVRGVIVADTALFPRELDPDELEAYFAEAQASIGAMSNSRHPLDPEIAASIRRPDPRVQLDATDLLLAVRCPVLLLQGDPARGAFMADEDVERAMGLLAQPSHVRFDGVGHGLQVEAPEAVATAIRTFAGELGASGPHVAQSPMPAGAPPQGG